MPAKWLRVLREDRAKKATTINKVRKTELNRWSLVSACGIRPARALEPGIWRPKAIAPRIEPITERIHGHQPPFPPCGKPWAADTSARGK